MHCQTKQMSVSIDLTLLGCPSTGLTWTSKISQTMSEGSQPKSALRLAGRMQSC